MKVSTLTDFLNTLPPDFEVNLEWKEEENSYSIEGFQINYDAQGKAHEVTLNIVMV